MQLALGEELPFGDDAFDATVAQLVVHFMPDPVAGLREMARVTREGVVAACVWDHAGQDGPLSPFWEVVHALDGEVEDESARVRARGTSRALRRGRTPRDRGRRRLDHRGAPRPSRTGGSRTRWA